MAEQVELTTSLAGMASKKGKSVRADASVETAGRRESVKRDGFDGFLKTFIGKDQTRNGLSGSRSGGGKKNAGQDRSSLVSTLDKQDKVGGCKTSGGAGKAAERLSSKDKATLRKALDKTVADDGAGETDVPVDAQVAAAAEEAARIIWNILYPDLGMPTMEGMPDLGADGVDVMAQLAALLSGKDAAPDALAGLGGAQLDAANLAEAMETTNASAEMNIDAVLAALEELLDGLPRSALEDALTKAAATMGLPLGENGADAFQELAKALRVEVLAVERGGEESAASLLQELDSNARQKSVDMTEETAGNSEADAEMLDLFKQFMTEKYASGSSERPINYWEAVSPEEADSLLDAFAEWLTLSGNTPEVQGLAADKSALGKTLAAALATSGGVAGGVPANLSAGEKTWNETFLESLLQSTAGKNSASLSDSLLVPGAGSQLSEDIDGDFGPVFPGRAGVENAPLAGQGQAQTPGIPAAPNAASAQNAASASTGTMLDQIENIQRLAEAMKMANRNGVKNLTLALSPPELGKVMLRVESRNGVVSAFLRVEKPEAVSQLANSMQQLRENLKAQGIELGELDIRQHSHGQAMGDGGQRQRRNQEAGDAESQEYRGRIGEIPDAETAETIAESAASGGGLNLFA